MYQKVMKSTSHRDTPLPKGPWVMTQKWDDLLFMHLPVTKKILQEALPPGLELDTYEDRAWITIIPFKITCIRIRNIPPIPFVHSFLELNVRTYVKRDGLLGVYFFSLDASNLAAVFGARIASLPYYYAEMSMKRKQQIIEFESKRSNAAHINFKGAYLPFGEAYAPEKSSLNHWLVERYYLWSYDNNSLYRGNIHHKRWTIHDVEVYITSQNMIPKLFEHEIDGSPMFNYASTKQVLFWPIQKVE